jgi:hypothetical protein
MTSCRFALVGDETDGNFLLSKTLRRIYGKEYVARLFELEGLGPVLASHKGAPMVVCLDLFSYDLDAATRAVGRIRDETFPTVVFSLYVDHDEYERRASELPGNWRDRFEHYYKTFKEPADVDFEEIVRMSLAPAEGEALFNVGAAEPVRLTPVFRKGLIEPAAEADRPTDRPTVFISYSRKDWDGFVSRLVSDLARGSQRVWVDQDFIEGGNDWLDAIGKALHVCNTLLLVLSPDALQSKWVKREYCYFLTHDKPVIPIMCRKVEAEDLPFELGPIQCLDFTQGSTDRARAALLGLLSQPRPGPEKPGS